MTDQRFPGRPGSGRHRGPAGRGVPTCASPPATCRSRRTSTRTVFGWRLRGTAEAPSFSDGTGHVIGHWRTDLPVAGEAGVLPYIYVTELDATLRTATDRGAELITPALPGRKPLDSGHPRPGR